MDPGSCRPVRTPHHLSRGPGPLRRRGASANPVLMEARQAGVRGTLERTIRCGCRAAVAVTRIAAMPDGRSLDAEVRSYYDEGREQARLQTLSRLEFIRTQELLRRVLPNPPARILDVGGG